MVAEIGHGIAAPFAGLILFDRGAEVIQAENPHPGEHDRIPKDNPA